MWIICIEGTLLLGVLTLEYATEVDADLCLRRGVLSHKCFRSALSTQFGRSSRRDMVDGCTALYSILSLMEVARSQ